MAKANYNVQIAARLTKREGGKSEARQGDVQQVIKELTEMQAEYLAEHGTALGSPLGVLNLRAQARAAKLIVKAKRAKKG